MKKKLCCRLLCIAVQAICCALSLADERTPIPPVFISEVLLMPVSGYGPRWFELVNKGDAPVNISNWTLCDRRGCIPLGAGVPPIPPGGLALLVLGNEAGLRISGSARRSAVIDILPENSASMFQDPTNECALYSGAVADRSNIVDYLCWDIRPDAKSMNHMNACDANLWRRGAGVYIGLQPAPGDTEPLREGGTLARLTFAKNWRAVHDWFICGEVEATPGEPNAQLPPSPHTGAREMRISYDEDNGTSFAWRGKQSSITQSRIQIATDDRFQQIITDVVTNSPYVQRPSLPPGKYFWRVRYEWDATNTVWSPSARLTIAEGPGYPVKDAKEKGDKDKQ